MSITLDKEIITKIKDKNISNIAKRAQEGKPLTSSQLKLLEAYGDLDGDEMISGERLAGILGLTGRRIRQLAGEGHIEKSARDLYPFPKSVQDYCRYLKTLAKSESIEEWKVEEAKIKCELGRQKIKERREELIREVTDEAWDIFLDILAPLRMEIVRMQLEPDVEQQWNRLVETAVKTANLRKSAEILDVESEAQSS